jgi:hypothetical protein
MAIGQPCEGLTPCKRPKIMIPANTVINDNRLL